ncbi:ribose-phosphate pyrophosphokinase [Pontibacter sp. G13]|uniref:ribose-phosphate pyrophosphokinase n=1 Tax=Pontibacter sp. G13 TaxID=3074898 RepID=UPI00288B714E|nr:ribose-phosphate pyrophosphokinase [Pontibacter sp. G13]WNJ21227.1 ribose-phosphate pyrophosphokinase [Pontibacter sp. G13]
MSSKIKIFSGSSSRYLAEKVSDFFGSPLGEIELLKFSDGEMQVYYEESIRGSDIFIVQSTFAPADNTMELLLLIDAAKRASANQVVVVIPYYGYARQDRKVRSRVSVGAKLMANILTAAGADRIVTMDLHAGQIQGFFDIPLDHLDASAVFVPYLKSLKLDNLCIASPDIGGSARARKYASYLGAELIIVDKHRKRPNEVASMRVIGDAKGKNIILVDDLVDTAGTITKAADLLIEEGALSVRAIATHPLLSGPAYERIAASKLDELVVTDTIPLKQELDKIKVLSIAPVFAKAFRKIHNFESISSLFI